MEDIVIPMSQGNMEDIEQDGNMTENANSESQMETESMGDSSIVQSSQQIYDREEKYVAQAVRSSFVKLMNLIIFLYRIVIDYSDLAEKYKDLYETDEVRREGDRLQRQVNELSNTIQRIQAPNMRVCRLFYPLSKTICLSKTIFLFQAMQKLDLAREKLHETHEEFEKARKKAQKSKQAFERVKKERFDLFMACFEHVSNEIDGIYKVLTLTICLILFSYFSLSYFTCIFVLGSCKKSICTSFFGPWKSRRTLSWWY